MCESTKIVIQCIIVSCFVLITNALHVNKRANDDGFCNPTKPDKLNVHIISHTHLDAGWVKTYDGYYKDSVHDIMSTVIEALTNEQAKANNRRFTFVEMTYFSRYWNELNDTAREVVRQLVTTGVLQFTSGGWVMNDEATPHYSMIIDQMSYGHRWINRTFGPDFLPTTGWQIDPFGHTREYGSILSQMGFNALFQGRIDYQDKEKRMKEKSMEMIWKTDDNLRYNNYMFTGITPTGYYPADGVCLNCYYKNNAPLLIKQVKAQSAGYRTNHLMSTMGGDFNYWAAELSFKNLDQLIEYINANETDIHLLYSTPDCYVKSVYESAVNWTDTKGDDFMPYADRRNDFWSGYFTSRPAFKYLMNYANTVLQASKQLTALTDIYGLSRQLIRPLEEAFGICLHHDGISGTSKQFVNDDYVQMLTRGLASSDLLMTAAYQKQFATNLKPQFCHQLNVSECLFVEESNSSLIEIAIYNPLAHEVIDFIRLPLFTTDYEIIDANGLIVGSQIETLQLFIQSLPDRKNKFGSRFEILFEAFLRPLAFTKYYLRKISAKREPLPQQTISQDSENVSDISISNDLLTVVIDGKSGILKGIQTANFTVNIRQNFGYYTRGNGKPSGAYAMHTNGSDPMVIEMNANVSVIRGNLTEEVVQEFNPWLKQIIRLYRDNNGVEFEWVVGPLPQDIDYEIISRWDTGFRSGGLFYTDSNGRQTLERKRDYRETWTLDTIEKVSSNYYPVTSWLFIRDVLSDLQLTVLPDRAQGGTSMRDGSLELMIHRRLHRDDGYGMEEKLDEPGVDGKGLVVRGKHILYVDRIADSMQNVKIISKTLFWRSLPMFVDLGDSPSVPPNNVSHSLTVGRLDPGVHLLTLEELEENVLFIRLENYLEKRETFQESVSVVLSELFSGIEILEATETGLTATQSLARTQQLKYKWNCGDCNNGYDNPLDDPAQFKITLTPNQIRSFVLRVKRISSNAI